jgi:hypothetical protein
MVLTLTPQDRYDKTERVVDSINVHIRIFALNEQEVEF